MDDLRTRKETSDVQQLFQAIANILEEDPRFCSVMLAVTLKADAEGQYISESFTGVADEFTGHENRSARAQMCHKMADSILRTAMHYTSAGCPDSEEAGLHAMSISTAH